ncbi:hypothetical protein H2204_002988 [Knufia peltigerae]|uniref:Alcohol dehydrogenase n=1 Tax=Knufia peltigerae TaxID=1002370 RepID=A0AA39D0V8_9EURO|nr:hypothetical protein H2204_002988 [Knufia peltigerae]
MENMRALKILQGAKTPTLETVEIPPVGPQDVLIKVKAAGLAPGPFNLARIGRLTHLPMTLGHEVAGVVESVGNSVRHVQPGDRVRLHPGLSCRSCDLCLSDRDHMCAQCGMMGFQGFSNDIPLFENYRNGGLADYVRAPEWAVDKLPENVSFELGSKVHDLATGLNVLRQADLQPGSTVIVTACTGAMGASVLKLATFFGIHRLVLVGRSTERLQDVAKLTGIPCDIVATDQLSEDWATKGGLVKSLKSLLPGGADAIIDLMPSGQAILQVVQALRTNGVLVHIGGNSASFDLPMVLFMANCWRIVGTRMHSRRDAKTILKWLQEGRFSAEDLITHRWEFDQWNEALALLQDRSEPMYMSVILP